MTSQIPKIRRRSMDTTGRTATQIHEHYLVEKELATRLRNANSNERPQLYRELYNEMFRRVPHHPQLTRKRTDASAVTGVARQLGLLSRFLNPESVYLEIGAGDCRLAKQIAGQTRRVVAVEVSDEISKIADAPGNFELVISDGVGIPVAPGSISVAYSNQVMEHLHPDDALEQLKNIYASLRSGGVYLCVTPNRLAGPSDISRHFDDEATCFHLKEYTYSELAALYRQAGFRKLMAYAGAAGWYVRCPLVALMGLESVLLALPKAVGMALGRFLPVRLLLDIRVAGIK